MHAMTSARRRTPTGGWCHEVGNRLTAMAGAVALLAGGGVTAANAAPPVQPDVPPNEYRGDLASGADW
jgi:hypothetical protein